METRGSRTQGKLVLAFTKKTEENNNGVKRESNLYRSGCTHLVVNLFHKLGEAPRT